MTYLIFGEECFPLSTRGCPSPLHSLRSRVEQSWVVSEWGHVASVTADTTHTPPPDLLETLPAGGAPASRVGSHLSSPPGNRRHPFRIG